MYKLPVVIRDDYIIFMEPAGSGPLIHCDIKRWNKTVRMNLLDDWEQLQELHGYHPMFADHYTSQGNKHKKFLELTGFKLIKRVDSKRALYGINFNYPEV